VHALSCACGKALDKSSTDRIVMNDVHLDMDRAARLVDRALPGRIVFGGVAQDFDPIAGAQRGARGPAERLVCQRAERVQIPDGRGGTRPCPRGHAGQRTPEAESPVPRMRQPFFASERTCR
jgi:hypothetical protein